MLAGRHASEVETYMMVMPCRSPFSRSVRARVLFAGLVIAMAGVGCESSTARAIRGARHFAAGNDALAESDTTRAVQELERAAVLVPHASEIQNHLGIAYLAEGRSQLAETAFERAVELDCENVAAEANLQRLRRSSDRFPVAGAMRKSPLPAETSTEGADMTGNQNGG